MTKQYSLCLLLNGVYDRGIKEWLEVKYAQYFKEGNSSEFAYRCTYTAANVIFGKGTWKVKNTLSQFDVDLE